MVWFSWVLNPWGESAGQEISFCLWCKNTGVGCHFLLQRIFPLGIKLRFPAWQADSLPLSHQGSAFLGLEKKKNHFMQAVCIIWYKVGVHQIFVGIKNQVYICIYSLSNMHDCCLWESSHKKHIFEFIRGFLLIAAICFIWTISSGSDLTFLAIKQLSRIFLLAIWVRCNFIFSSLISQWNKGKSTNNFQMREKKLFMVFCIFLCDIQMTGNNLFCGYPYLPVVLHMQRFSFMLICWGVLQLNFLKAIKEKAF